METYRVVVGIDWGDEKHAVFLIDQEEHVRERGEVEQTPEGLTEWALTLRQRFPGIQIAVCLEQSRGALIYALMKFPIFALVPVNPIQLAKFREGLRCSGPKDDPTDAELLADLCAKHSDRLRIWKPDTEETRLLTLLNEDRRQLVDRRTALTNQLTSQLKQYFPQVLSLCGKLYDTLACALLQRWSSLSELQQATEEEIRQVYHQYGRCSQQQLEQRLQRIHQAVPLTTDQAIVQSRQLLVSVIVREMQVLCEAIRQYDKKIEGLFTAHPDYLIFHSFPGAGPAMGPRTLCAFGSDRERFATALDIQCLSGIAPVTRKTGKSWVVLRRWACNKFMRQTFHEYAAISRKYSLWARAYYNMMKERTGEHHAAIRALAFKWIRIFFRCWQDRTPYDESTYMASLQRRNSPLLKYLPATTTDA